MSEVYLCPIAKKMSRMFAFQTVGLKTILPLCFNICHENVG